MSELLWMESGARLIGGDIGGAAAVAGRGLGPLDVQVKQLHLLGGRRRRQPLG